MPSVRRMRARIGCCRLMILRGRGAGGGRWLVRGRWLRGGSPGGGDALVLWDGAIGAKGGGKGSCARYAIGLAGCSVENGVLFSRAN